MYSGLIPIDMKDPSRALFFVFQPTDGPPVDEVTIWLNGGPGCSSLTGLFMELGPASITKDQKIKHNPYSWNANASVIFLDQPVNVGYSYSSPRLNWSASCGPSESPKEN